MAERAAGTASREEVLRFIAALKADESLREEVERAILSEKLLAVPEQLAKLAAEVTKLTAAVHELMVIVQSHSERLDRIETDVRDLKTDVGELKTDVGDLKGDLLEQRLRTAPDDYLYEHVVGGTALTKAQVTQLARERAYGLSPLGMDDMKDLREADLVVVGGHHPETRERISAVVEASSRAGRLDVERARRRADILARHGHRVVAVVVARYPLDEQWRRLAEETGVHIHIAGGDARAA